MTLEEILKSLKKGEIRQYETVDEYNHCHIIEVRRNENGLYGITLERKYTLGFYDSIEEIFNELKNYYWAQWSKLNYEIFKDRLELKAENAKLEKALKSACKIIDDVVICSECPTNNFCKKKSGGTCAEKIFDNLLKEADEE